MTAKRSNKGGSKKREPFVPSQDWIDAFHAQFGQPEFLESCERYARRQADHVAYAGVAVDDLYAAEVVQDVIDDTLFGVIAWDPARVSLEQHVLDAVKSRMRHRCVRARRFPHERLDGVAIERAEAALASQQEGLVERRELNRVAATVLAAVRALAADDVEILWLLDSFEQEEFKRVDVLRATQLTRLQYDAARKRLHRLLEQLPAELREQARNLR